MTKTIYAFSGTHSTGKTTILKSIGKMSQFLFWNKYTSVTRDAKKKGAKINSEVNDLSQNAILDEALKSEQRFKNTEINTIIDRSMLDTYAYTKYFHSKGQLSDETLERVKAIFLDRAEHLYAHIFITSPDFDNVLDGVREVGDEFRFGVHNCIMNILEENNIKNYTTLTGSNEKRVDTVIRTMYEIEAIAPVIKPITDINDILKDIHKLTPEVKDFATRAFRMNCQTQAMPVGVFINNKIEGVMYINEVNEELLILNHIYSHKNYKNIGNELYRFLISTAVKKDTRYVAFYMEEGTDKFYADKVRHTYGVSNDEYKNKIAIIDTYSINRLSELKAAEISKLLSSSCI